MPHSPNMAHRSASQEVDHSRPRLSRSVGVQGRGWPRSRRGLRPRCSRGRPRSIASSRIWHTGVRHRKWITAAPGCPGREAHKVAAVRALRGLRPRCSRGRPRSIASSRIWHTGVRHRKWITAAPGCPVREAHKVAAGRAPRGLRPRCSRGRLRSIALVPNMAHRSASQEVDHSRPGCPGREAHKVAAGRARRGLRPRCSRGRLRSIALVPNMAHKSASQEVDHSRPRLSRSGGAQGRGWPRSARASPASQPRAAAIHRSRRGLRPRCSRGRPRSTSRSVLLRGRRA